MIATRWKRTRDIFAAEQTDFVSMRIHALYVTKGVRRACGVQFFIFFIFFLFAYSRVDTDLMFVDFSQVRVHEKVFYSPRARLVPLEEQSETPKSRKNYEPSTGTGQHFCSVGRGVTRTGRDFAANVHDP
jgi:hypothetical protein